MKNFIILLKKHYWELLASQDVRREKRLKASASAYVKKLQFDALREAFPSPQNVKRLIVFLAPSEDIVNGGIMSIVSLYEESLTMKAVHGAECVLCSVPSDQPPLLRYTKFENEAQLLDFRDTFDYFSEVDKVLIHIPELYIKSYLKNINGITRRKFKQIDTCHNVMLQNIDFMDFEDFDLLRELGKTTCTTAHKAYSNQETKKRAKCTVKLLSVFISPEQYNRTDYLEKEDILLLSPDFHPDRDKILGQIQDEFPALQIITIQDMTYSEYKSIISKAKWTFTFGEGLDGYFIETIFSGGVSFAAYNDRFFTEDFQSLKTVFSNGYNNIADNIIKCIQYLDNPSNYRRYQDKMFELCRSYYSHDRYRKKLEEYYESSFSPL